jgi:hypothetical protein
MSKGEAGDAESEKPQKDLASSVEADTSGVCSMAKCKEYRQVQKARGILQNMVSLLSMTPSDVSYPP